MDPQRTPQQVGREYAVRDLVAYIAAQEQRIASLEASLARAAHIADEAFGLGPVEPIEDTLTRIESGIFELRRRIADLEERLDAQVIGAPAW